MLGLYAVGASDFPDYREPNCYRAKLDLRALYLDVEAGGIEDVPRLNPVSAWGYRLSQLSGWQSASLDSQLGLLSRAGRTLAMRQAHPTLGLRGHLLDSAATIRASRDWPWNAWSTRYWQSPRSVAAPRASNKPRSRGMAGL